MGAHVVFVALALVHAGCGGSGTTSDEVPVETGGTGGGGGASGTGGASGKGGAGGGGGAAGKGGSSVVTGGSGGAAGTAGTAGAAGTAGMAGAAGAAGKAGNAGAAGAGICQPDADGDGIPDEIEGKSKNLDSDKDGIPDWMDPDSDGDGIPDAVEGQTKSNGCQSPQNSDGKDTPDFQDTDSDDNGLPDAKEVYPDGSPYSAAKGVADTDGDKYPDYADPDNDGDSLPDTVELVAGVAVDTDKDGIPDLDDPDSDGDGIADGMDGSGDADKDGTPNFRDLDSDGDGIPDACEAGPNHKLADPPVDTDKDGKADFLDVDSDADGILDKDEDKNANCKVDPGETDPRKADTDGDGASDLIEITLGSDPLDPFTTPTSLGKFYFILPYNGPAQPDVATMAIDTRLQRADVAFLVDTTGTMGGELSALKSGLTGMIQKLGGEIPDVGIGIAGHDDVPADPYGQAGDLPLYIPKGGMVTTVQADSLMAVSGLAIHSGGDLPESQVLAMWRALENDWYAYPPGQLIKPETLPGGRFGGIGFRTTALPIVVSVTDAPFHNGRRASDPATLHDPYGFNGQAPYPAPTIDTLVKTMKDSGARFIGVAANDGIRTGDPYDDMAYLADQSGSLAPPSAFGGKCKTGLAGTNLTNPDGPGNTCRLVFDIYKNGTGLTDRIVDGVKAILKSILLDVRVVAIPDDPSIDNQFTDSVDTFIDSVEVSISGGDDPTNPGAVCQVLSVAQVSDAWTGAKGLIQGGDTYWDTVKSVIPTTKLCYTIKPIPNKTIKATQKVQTFHAVLQVKAKIGTKGEVDFGAPRDILFVIPPTAQ